MSLSHDCPYPTDRKSNGIGLHLYNLIGYKRDGRGGTRTRDLTDVNRAL